MSGPKNDIDLLKAWLHWKNLEIAKCKLHTGAKHEDEEFVSTIEHVLQGYESREKEIEDLKEQLVAWAQLSDKWESDEDKLESALAKEREASRQLVEALEYLNIHNRGHIPGNTNVHQRCNQCVIEEALANFKASKAEEEKI